MRSQRASRPPQAGYRFALLAVLISLAGAVVIPLVAVEVVQVIPPARFAFGPSGLQAEVSDSAEVVVLVGPRVFEEAASSETPDATRLMPTARGVERSEWHPDAAEMPPTDPPASEPLVPQPHPFDAPSTPLMEAPRAVPTDAQTPTGSNPAPEATPAPVEILTESGRTEVITHVVAEGDTLSELADRFKVSIETIWWANDLQNDLLAIGQKLVILPVSGLLHKVKDGEALTDLAERYQSDVFAIIRLNRLANPDKLVAGTALVIPGGRLEPGDGGAKARPEAGATPMSPSEQREVTTYSVQPGDSLLAIANRFGVSLATILRANGLKETSLIVPGQPITVLPRSGLLHPVADGDNLQAIAARYGVSAQEILAANGLANPHALAVGARLLVPEREGWRPDQAPRAEAIAPPRVAGERYRVRPGDTLSGVASQTGQSAEQLVKLNGLVEPFILQIGQELVLPGGSAPPLTAEAGPRAGPPGPRPRRHTVQAGDTLSGIASRYSTRVDDLAAANGLKAPYLLALGQELVIGGPAAEPATIPVKQEAPAKVQEYTVQAGDTLISLANRFGATVVALAGLNGLAEPYPLRIGQRLVLPAGAPAPPPAPVAAPGPRPTPTPVPAPARPQPAPAPPSAPAPAAPPAPAPQPAPARPPSVPAAPAGTPMQIALQFLGTRYVWGGSSPQQGFDCSGLVAWSFRQAGYRMPRDMWGQLQSGQRVARPDLRPGDIVFFVNTYMRGLSHNGIYLGDGKFVHAATESLGIIVSRLDETYWAARYYGAVRPNR